MPNYPYDELSAPLDLENLERLNDNYDQIQADISSVSSSTTIKIDQVATDFNAKISTQNSKISAQDEKIDNFVENTAALAFEEVVENSKLNWLEAVDTFVDLSLTYPTPSIGDTAMVKEQGEVYRFDGQTWLNIQQIDPAPYNELDTRLTNDIEANKVFTKLVGGVVVASDPKGNGLANANTITLETTNHGFIVGDTIAVENAGSPKNPTAFLISFNSSATATGVFAVTINGTTYNINVVSGDSATTIGGKLVALNLPFTLISSGSDVLYTAGSSDVNVTLNAGTTGVTNSYKVDNTIDYNYLRTTVTEVAGAVLTVSNNLQRSISNAFVKKDYTSYIQQQLNLSSETDGKVYIETGVFNIFDKLAPMYDLKSLEVVGSGADSVLDFSGIVGTKTAYAFSKNILYYTDGNGMTIADSSNITFKDVKLLGREQPPVKFTNVSNVFFDRATLMMKKAVGMNNAIVSVYSTSSGRAPSNYRFRDCVVSSHGMGLIFLGDFSNPVKNVKIESSSFSLNTDGNYGSLNLVEFVKFDNNTSDVEISGCTFNGGELSSITIEEGCRNINIHDNDFYDTKNQFIRVAKGQTNLSCYDIMIKKNRFFNYVFAVTVETTTTNMTLYGLTVEDNVASAKTTTNVSSFLNIRKTDRLVIKNNKILNTDVATASIILVVDCTDVTIELNDLPKLGNIDIGQVRVITSTGVWVKRNRLATLVLRYVTDGHVIDNEVMARIGLENNYDVETRGNGINLGDYQSVAQYYALIQITSTDSATNAGVNQVHFNRLFTTKGAKGITTSPVSIVLNASQNVLQGTT